MIKKPLLRWRGGTPVAYYEAGRNSNLYKRRTEIGDGDVAVLRAGKSLRNIARHLDQNYDVAHGIINTLVQNIVGAHGITIEPQPRDSDGKIVQSAAKSIRLALDKWMRRPEASWQYDYPCTQRILARSYLRDGEGLSQALEGAVPQHEHGVPEIPFSLELIESDLLPFDLNEEKTNTVGGIQRSIWNRPLNYHFLKKHPGGVFSGGSETRKVPASRVMHAKIVHRIGQLRGVSVFAPVILRMDDLKDYEESERVAAKVAASMAAVIKKGTPDEYHADDKEFESDGSEAPRDLKFIPGMIFDELRPGESIEMIDTSRPNSSLLAHRQGQLRAIASGTGVSYSSAAKSYDGTYSAQRQELVEQWGAYQVVAAELINSSIRPTYERFLEAAITGRYKLDLSGVDPETVFEALYIPPTMPWIDPEREARANFWLEKALHDSAQNIMRRAGKNPYDILDQQISWKELKQEAGLSSEFPSNVGGDDDDNDDNVVELKTNQDKA